MQLSGFGVGGEDHFGIGSDLDRKGIDDLQ
jgi:hypothetical protein